MMIKCQNCGFENQMGSIFCRECGGKLDMDAIDPNKLQKDVNKEKNIKLAKKRIKSAISASISILIVAGFIFAVIYRGWEDNKDYSVVEETESEAAAAAQKKFDAVLRGTTVGKAKFSYPEINYMFRDQVVKPLYELDSFAKIVSFEMAYDEEKNQPMANIWIKIKDKVPVRYVVRGDIIHNASDPDSKEEVQLPIDIDVKRLDIGLIPLFVSTHTFLNGLMPLLDNESMRNFFRRAQNVEFTPEGMNVEFGKGGPAPASSLTPSSSGKPSASAGVAALKGGSTAALSEKDEAAREAARQKAEEKKQKAAEEAEKKKALEEERKRKAEEYKQQQKEKEEERKRKAEEERERKKQEKEERERQIREENERRRQEREDRRNNNYNNNNRNSRSSRNNRNNRW